MAWINRESHGSSLTQNQLKQISTGATITVSQTLANCDVLQLGRLSGGMLQLPASHGISTLTLYTSMDGTNFYAPTDHEGNAITMTCTSGSDPNPIVLPPSVYNMPVLKFKADAGSDVEAEYYVIG